MDDIVGQLQKATGTDREIDYAICETIFPYLAQHNYVRRPGDNGWHTSTPSVKGADRVAPASAYTESLDAALTLVPDGWHCMLYSETCVAELYPTVGVKRPAGIQARGQGNTLALAICIAAFKARTAYGQLLGGEK